MAANAPSAHALLDLLVGNLDGQHPVKGDAGLVQGFRLTQGPGHAVQDIAPGAVRLGHPLGHDADDHLVGDQLTRVHIGLGLQAHGGAVLDGGPEHIAGGDGGDVQLFAQNFSLGAFPGSGGAQ